MRHWMLAGVIVVAGTSVGGYAFASTSPILKASGERRHTTLVSQNVRRIRAAFRAFPVCPPRDRRVPSSTTAGARAALVPAGAQQVLLCRYSGLGAYPRPAGPRSFRLIAHHLVLAHSIVEDLENKLNALKAVTGVQSCPADNGAAIIAFFRYRSASKIDDPVTIHLGGCSIVSNGHVNREAGPALVLQVKALTRPSRRQHGRQALPG
jgi:hypothetical protein